MSELGLMRLRDFADSVRLGGLFCRGGFGAVGNRTYGMALRGARKISIAFAVHSVDPFYSWVSLCLTQPTNLVLTIETRNSLIMKGGA